MLPGYSRLIEDPEAFRRTCLDATAGILLLVMPVTVGLVVLALGLAYLFVELYRTVPLPEEATYLTLQFVPRWLTDTWSFRSVHYFP